MTAYRDLMVFIVAFAMFLVAAITLGHAGMTCRQVLGSTQCTDDNGSNFTGRNVLGSQQWTGTIQRGDGRVEQFNQTCRYVLGALRCD